MLSSVASSSGGAQDVRPSVGFYFSDVPPTRTPIDFKLGSKAIDIPAGRSDYAIEDTYTLPVDVEVLSVYPHAHYLAKDVKAFATRPDGQVTPLIWIRDWDFHWQDDYRYATPLHLPRGAVLTMRYTYDNSVENPRNPQIPPRRAMWGQQSFDEMGNLWIQVLTPDARDLDILDRSFRPKAAADDAAGYEMMIQREPGNIAYHNDAALLYLELGRSAEALAHFGAVARVQPRSAAAQFNIGTAFTQAGRLGDAIDRYQKALQLEPDYALAHINWGNALVATGRLTEARDHYRSALRIDAKSPVAHNNLGQVLLQSGDTDAGMAQFREAIRLDAAYSEPHYNLAVALRGRGDLSEAIAEIRRAIELKADWPPALAELSRLLAMRR